MNMSFYKNKKACYYCNNDKSNTFSYDIYRNEIGASRKEIWDNLLRLLR